MWGRAIQLPCNRITKSMQDADIQCELKGVQMKDLSAYYFGANLYTLVPRHLEYDLRWMKDHGTKNVCFGIREKELRGERDGKWNFRHMCNMAEKVGIDVFVVPSFWGNMFAGVVGTHSIFSWTHPELWMRDVEGKPVQTGFGPITSVHYPETFEFIYGTAKKMLQDYPVKGLIWDEPKMLHLCDYSEAAQKKMPPNLSESDIQAWQMQQAASFFSKVMVELKKNYKEVEQWCFIEANQKWALKDFASMDGLDVFGVDGKPYHHEDLKKKIRSNKPLIPNCIPFIEEAKKNNKETMILLENHALPLNAHEIWDKRMDQVVGLNPDHWIYYYYPRDLEDPEANMRMVEKWMDKVQAAR